MKSERSMQQVYWPTFVITRIKAFVGRTVGSLSASDLDNLRGGWLKCVEESWKDPRLDDNLRAHYWAIQGRIEYDQTRAAAQQRPTSSVTLPEFPVPQAATEPAKGMPLPVREVQTPSIEALPPPPLGEKDEVAAENQPPSAPEDLPTVELITAEEPRSLEVAEVEPTDARLVVYQRICRAIQEACKLDTVLGLKLQAERHALAALLSDDRKAQQEFCEARLKAIQRAGEIIADFEKQALIHDDAGKFIAAEIIGDSGESRQDIGGKSVDAKKSKTEILKQNGLGLRTANRYERLAGPPKPEIREAVKIVTENYFAEKREEGKLPTIKGLLKVVEETVGIAPKPKSSAAERSVRRLLALTRNFIAPEGGFTEEFLKAQKITERDLKDYRTFVECLRVFHPYAKSKLQSRL
jgi:hypothetical protein